jgi:hypothetical protein
MRRLPRSLLLLACGVASFGCARDTIPNTDVPDTSENRDVLGFCERYREAVEERDVGGLLGLASPRYFDDNGTPGATDDVDYETLGDKLSAWREQLLDVRYEIRYRRVTFARDRILVDYRYTANFRVSTGDGDRWARRLADNRLTLVREADEYRILSGM